MDIDFPALLQQLAYQDQLYGNIAFGSLAFETARKEQDDYLNIWNGAIASAFGMPRQWLPEKIPHYDWDQLRRGVMATGGVRNQSLMAVMPSEYDVAARRIMSGVSDGIYPIRDLVFKRIERGDCTALEAMQHRLKLRYFEPFPEVSKALRAGVNPLLLLMNNEKPTPTSDQLFDPLEQPTGAIRYASEADGIETDEDGLEREFDEGEDDIPGTEGGWIVKLSNTAEVWDFLNGFQFVGEYSVDNERNDVFDLEIDLKADYNWFVKSLLDQCGLNAFHNGLVPRLEED